MNRQPAPSGEEDAVGLSDWFWSRQPVTLGGPGGLVKPLAARQLAEQPAKLEPRAATHHPSRFGARRVQSTSRHQNLTPSKLAGFLADGLDGDPVAQAELFLEMEDRDLHLVSVLNTRREAVAQLPVVVVPASAGARDRRVATFVQETINNIDNFEGALVELMNAVPHGYAGAEIDWTVSGGKVGVRSLLWRSPTFFRPDPDHVDRWRVLTDADPVQGELLQPGAWVWHEARAKAGQTAAQAALGRVLAWAWMFKSYTLKDWLTFTETYGAPLRIGRYQPGTSEADRDILYSVVQALGADAAAVLPEGTTVEFIEAGQTRSSVDVYRLLVEWAEKAQSKAVLGQTLTTDEGKSGTRAQAQVHEDVRQDLLRADAGRLGRTLTRDLVRPLVQMQFGSQVPTPRLTLRSEPPEDVAGRASLYVNLSKLGVRFPTKHIHATFGIPEPVGDEPTYGELAATATAPLSERPQRVRTLAEGVSQPLSREAERIIQEALAGGGRQGWETVVAQLREALGAYQTPEEIGTAFVEILEGLDIEELGVALADELDRAELIGRAQVLSDERPVEEWPRVPPREAMAWWAGRVPMARDEWVALGAANRATAFGAAKAATLEAATVMHEALGRAIAEGNTLAEFEDDLAAQWTARGITGPNPRYLALVFQNNVMTAYNAGRYTAQAAAADRRPYLLYDAVDDDRTRATHAAMNGACYPATHPIWDTWYPPNGHHCRCGVVSLTAADVAARGITVRDELPTQSARGPDGSTVVAPRLPDPGWRTNAAKTPTEFDWSRYPADWRRALGVEES